MIQLCYVILSNCLLEAPCHQASQLGRLKAEATDKADRGAVDGSRSRELGERGLEGGSACTDGVSEEAVAHGWLLLGPGVLVRCVSEL